VTIGALKQMLEHAQAEEENEHSKEWLKIFSREAEKEMTAALKLVAGEKEEEADIIDFVELYQEFEALERRVKVHGIHIQQIRLEVNEGEF